MHRRLLLASLSVALTFCHAAPTKGASITYNIQNYPALQNGYTFSGTITTDGTIGSLHSSDITAWSYTITNGVITDHESGGSANVIINATVSASPSQITIAFPPIPSSIGNTLVLLTHGNVDTVEWSRVATSSPIDIYNAGVNGATGNAWADVANYPPGLTLGGDPWIIAQAVPEPGTLTLALLAITCLAVVQWTRRRQAAGLLTRPDSRLVNRPL